MTAPSTFAPERVTALRERMGLTPSGMAEHCYTSRQTVFNWETGRNPPTGPAVKMLELLEDQYVGTERRSHRKGP